MEQNKNSFSFPALNQSRSEIRILRLHPDPDPKAPIYCTLYLAYLDRFPVAEYTALSYTWGDPRDTTTIYLYDQPFQITTNLGRALRAIRDPRKAVPVWVDAVCINQNDTKERSHQVALMSKVYQNAHIVILWTDSKNSDIQDALPYLTYNYNYDGTSEDGYRFTDTLLSMLPKAPEKRERIVQQIIAAIFASPVWRRMWIIQEMTLATEIYILCGSSYIPWRTVAHLATIFLARYNTRENAGVLGLRGLRTVYRISIFWRENYPDSAPPDFLRACYDFGHCQCSDPLDKIYALLNIVPNKLGLVPDYNTSIVKLYCKVARSYMLATNGLKILGGIWQYSTHSTCINPETAEAQELRNRRLRSGNERQQALLPSWAIDFRSGGFDDMATIFKDRFENPNDVPEIPLNRGSVASIHSPRDPMLLNITGITIDKITYVSKDPGKSTTRTETLLRFMHDSGKTIRMAAKNQGYKYQSKEAAENAYWKTLLANRFTPTRIPGSGIAYTDRVEIRYDVNGVWRRGLDGWISRIPDANSQTRPRTKSLFHNAFRKSKDAEAPIELTQPRPMPGKVSPDGTWAPPRKRSVDHYVAQQTEIREAIKNTPPSTEEIAIFQQGVIDSTKGFCFGLTQRGRFVLVPDSSEPGDLICGLCGGFGPYILRPGKERQDRGTVTLVGPAYVHELELSKEWESRPRGSEQVFMIK